MWWFKSAGWKSDKYFSLSWLQNWIPLLPEITKNWTWTSTSSSLSLYLRVYQIWNPPLSDQQPCKGPSGTSLWSGPATTTTTHDIIAARCSAAARLMSSPQAQTRSVGNNVSLGVICQEAFCCCGEESDWGCTRGRDEGQKNTYCLSAVLCLFDQLRSEV